MLFELRQYRMKPGQAENWVRLMEEKIIPFQIAKGMVVVGSWVGEAEPDLYVWIRRFDSEEERVRLYAEVYESDFWKNEIAPIAGDMIYRDKHVITRLLPTAKSVLR